MTHALSGKEWKHLLPVVHLDIVVFGILAMDLPLDLVPDQATTPG